MSTDASRHSRRVAVGACEIRYLRSGAGRSVVFLHTLRTQLDYFLPLMMELGTAFDAIALDLPGHGHSQAPPAAYTAEFFVEMTAQFLEAIDAREAVVIGESIGASIALGLAARRSARIARVFALNPYDYGRWGGIRRSSPLANVLFTAMQWPLAGPIVARAGTKGVLRRVLEGGLHDRRKLPPELLDELHQCGSLPGHARAFRSLCLEWKSWIAARAAYPNIRVPVILAYGVDDWSRPEEREANARLIPGVRSVILSGCGHFSSLDDPKQIANIINQEIR